LYYSLKCPGRIDKTVSKNNDEHEKYKGAELIIDKNKESLRQGYEVDSINKKKCVACKNNCPIEVDKKRGKKRYNECR
jgi:hypothetical protein